MMMMMMMMIIIIIIIIILIIIHCVVAQLIGHKGDKRYNSLDYTYFVCVLFFILYT